MQTTRIKAREVHEGQLVRVHGEQFKVARKVTVKQSGHGMSVTLFRPSGLPYATNGSRLIEVVL